MPFTVSRARTATLRANRNASGITTNGIYRRVGRAQVFAVIRKMIVPLLLALPLIPSASGQSFQHRRHGDKWDDAIDFWTEAVCSTRNAKTVNFYRVLTVEPSSRSRGNASDAIGFSADLIRGIGRRCDAVVTFRSCHFRVSGRSSNESGGAFACDSRRPERPARVAATNSSWHVASGDRTGAENGERNYTDTREINVIVSNCGRSFDELLGHEEFLRWNARHQFVVLTLYERHVDPEELNSTIESVLLTFWFRRKIQNVLLFAPLTECGLTVMYTYNPFVRVNESGGEWGRVEALNVPSRTDVLRYLSSITQRRTENLNGYPLRVGMFQRFLTVKKVENPPPGSVYESSGGYGGSDGIALGTVARKMNFTVIAVPPSDRLDYGSRLENGTFVGMLGDIVYDRINATFVSFFVTQYEKHASRIEFTTQIDYDKICVIVPKAPMIPKRLRIFHVFEASVWIYLGMFHMIMYFAWYLLQWLSPRRAGKVDIWMTLYRGLLVNTGGPVRLPTASSERILLTGVFVACVTLTGIFNGTLYTSFAKTMYYKDIDTLHELDASGLPITYDTVGEDNIFSGSNDNDPPALMMRLKQKMIRGPHGILHAAQYRNTSGLMMEHHFNLMRELMVDKNGEHLTHLVKHCPAKFYLAYLLPKYSVLGGNMNELLSRMNQAGLPIVWHQRTIDRAVLARKIAKEAKWPPRTSQFIPFQLTDTQTAFYLLGAGLALATVTFFCEKC